VGETFYELDCGCDEPVVLEVTEQAKLIFHGWDEANLEIEAAAIELGFRPSLCWRLYHVTGSLAVELAWAVRNDRPVNLPYIELLLDIVESTAERFDPTELLSHAALYGNMPVAELLLQRGTVVNENLLRFSPGRPMRRLLQRYYEAQP